MIKLQFVLHSQDSRRHSQFQVFLLDFYQQMQCKILCETVEWMIEFLYMKIGEPKLNAQCHLLNWNATVRHHPRSLCYKTIFITELNRLNWNGRKYFQWNSRNGVCTRWQGGNRSLHNHITRSGEHQFPTLKCSFPPSFAGSVRLPFAWCFVQSIKLTKFRSLKPNPKFMFIQFKSFTHQCTTDRMSHFKYAKVSCT